MIIIFIKFRIKDNEIYNLKIANNEQIKVLKDEIVNDVVQILTVTYNV